MKELVTVGEMMRLMKNQTHIILVHVNISRWGKGNTGLPSSGFRKYPFFPSRIREGFPKICETFAIEKSAYASTQDLLK